MCLFSARSPTETNTPSEIIPNPVSECIMRIEELRISGLTQKSTTGHITKIGSTPITKI